MRKLGLEFGLSDQGRLPSDLQNGAHIGSTCYGTGILAHYGMCVGALGNLLQQGSGDIELPQAGGQTKIAYQCLYRYMSIQRALAHRVGNSVASFTEDGGIPLEHRG